MIVSYNYDNRYASRCLMIKFSLPALSMMLSSYRELVRLWTKCSSCVGFCVSLGKEFFDKGLQEVDDSILPQFIQWAGDKIAPRVLLSYAILYWFSCKVYRNMNFICLSLHCNHYNTQYSC